MGVFKMSLALALIAGSIASGGFLAMNDTSVAHHATTTVLADEGGIDIDPINCHTTGRGWPGANFGQGCTKEEMQEFVEEQKREGNVQQG